MGKLIIDKVTGTVLNIEGCYVIEGEQLDDNFTDSEIAELADRVGIVQQDVGVEDVVLFHVTSWRGGGGCGGRRAPRAGARRRAPPPRPRRR